MAKIIVNNENKKSTIAPEIYGHFSVASRKMYLRGIICRGEFRYTKRKRHAY